MSRELRDMWSEIKRHRWRGSTFPIRTSRIFLWGVHRVLWPVHRESLIPSPNVRRPLCFARRNERAVNPIVPLNAVVTYAGSKLLTNSRLKFVARERKCARQLRRGRSRILSACEWICFRGPVKRKPSKWKERLYIGNIILFSEVFWLKYSSFTVTFKITHSKHLQNYLNETFYYSLFLLYSLFIIVTFHLYFQIPNV